VLPAPRRRRKYRRCSRERRLDVEEHPAAQRPGLAERIRAQFAGTAPADFEAQQLQYMRRVGVVTIEPARHFVMVDRPQALNEALRKFLDR
jgi:pimeloyl-ACP methyl ester carboxylesterase